MLVAQEGARHDVVQDRHSAKRSSDLKRARQAMRADVMRPQSHNLATERDDRTFVGTVIAGDEVEGCCLARPVRTDKRNGLVFIHGKADILHRSQSTKPLAEVADDERFRHRYRARVRWRPAMRAYASLRTPISPVGRHRITAIRMRL